MMKSTPLTEQTPRDAQGLDDIRLSIALCVRNRVAVARRCLESFRRQSVPPYEVIISDDSDAEHAARMEQLAREFGATYVRGPRKGLYANRNNAALACTGTHILTSDDDHTHPIDYLERVREKVVSAPTRIWIMGEKHPTAAPDEPVTCPAELGDGGVGVAPVDPSRCAAISDGCAVYPASIFARGPIYDDAYSFGNLWYLLGWELKNAGYQISFNDATHVVHHVDSSDRMADREFLKMQLLANLYVFTIYCTRLRPSLPRIARLTYAALRSIVRKQTLQGYTVAVRLPIGGVVESIRRGLTRKSRVEPR